MSKEMMTPFGGGLPSTAALGAALANYKAPASSGGGGKNYLKLAKHGGWVYGPEETEAEGTFAINPMSIRAGYVCWDEGEKAGEVMADLMMGEAMIDPKDLPQTNAEWEAQVGFDLVGFDLVGFDLAGVSGNDKGIELQYATNSVGGKRAHKMVVDAIREQYAKDPAKCVPVVTLEMDSYQHKKYGKIFTPIFELVDWITMDGGGGKKPAKKKAAAKKEPVKTRKRK